MREDYPKRDDVNWLKHTVAWKDDDWNVTFAYRPVRLNTLSNDRIQSFPPRPSALTRALPAQIVTSSSRKEHFEMSEFTMPSARVQKVGEVASCWPCQSEAARQEFPHLSFGIRRRKPTRRWMMRSRSILIIADPWSSTPGNSRSTTRSDPTRCRSGAPAVKACAALAR